MPLHSFRGRETPLSLFLALATWIGLATFPTLAAAATWNGSAALTTDYVWRGSSQSQGDPAVQASFKVVGDSGWYASVWGSSVEFAPQTRASSELDITLGWGRSIHENWAIDINALRYQYPSTAVDLNWTELNATVTFKDNYWVSLGYSHEALGYDASGSYASLGLKLPINDVLRLEAGLGHYFLSDSVVAENSYTHGLLSVVWTFKSPFEARLTAHATDTNAKRIFGNDFAGTRIEAALQATF